MTFGPQITHLDVKTSNVLLIETLGATDTATCPCGHCQGCTLALCGFGAPGCEEQHCAADTDPGKDKDQPQTPKATL